MANDDFKLFMYKEDEYLKQRKLNKKFYKSLKGKGFNIQAIYRGKIPGINIGGIYYENTKNLPASARTAIVLQIEEPSTELLEKLTKGKPLFFNLIDGTKASLNIYNFSNERQGVALAIYGKPVDMNPHELKYCKYGTEHLPYYEWVLQKGTLPYHVEQKTFQKLFPNHIKDLFNDNK